VFDHWFVTGGFKQNMKVQLVPSHFSKFFQDLSRWDCHIVSFTTSKIVHGWLGILICRIYHRACNSRLLSVAGKIPEILFEAVFMNRLEIP
jgi:hypothetical protein